MSTEFLQRPMRVLHLEDDEHDQELVREMLSADGLRCELLAVKTSGEFEAALHAGGFDLIISDFSLPSFDGLRALAAARKLSPRTPFIFFSGTIGEEAAVESLKHGATDYVLKQRPQRLVGAIRNALRMAGEQVLRRQAEEELHRVEEQFLRAQRLESLGALVGGIAHDLNNTLVPIVVGVEILKTQMLSPDAESMVCTMETSARRSTEMVRQMLHFARGGETVKSTVRLDRLVKEMGKIIADTFPKNIRCHAQADKDAWPVSGFPTQLHQVLMNLCVNARDAMPRGGSLTLLAENTKLAPDEAKLHSDARPGNYLCLAVADTGDGIPPAVMDKIFQPFFTTKGPGKGTGLGLSTCRSIVKNHDGFITVQSRPGMGTIFKVFLPASTAEMPEAAPAPAPVPPIGNGELILVVDDEESILAITRAALENYNYKVLTATGGAEAIGRFAENTEGIRLVICDLAMPFMDGLATVTALRQIQPGIKLILASGSEQEMEKVLKQIPGDSYIAKPFTSETLLRAVHDALAKTGGK